MQQVKEQVKASVIFVCLVNLTVTGCSTGSIQYVSSRGSSCVCVPFYRARIPADLLYQQWSTIVIHPTACFSCHNSANLAKSLFSVLSMRLLHQSWILILIDKQTTEAGISFCSKSYGYPKVGDLYGSFMLTKNSKQGSGRRKDSPAGSCSTLSLLCFGCVGGNGKQPPQHTAYLMSLAPN